LSSPDQPPPQGAPPRNNSLDYHSARILLILAAYSETQNRPLDGLTKLAKLDFLIRYPTFLEQLTPKILRQELPVSLMPTQNEVAAVESRMIRYKYGPWDDRYYPILGILIGLGLVEPSSGKGRVALAVTEAGALIASHISADPSWQLVSQRAHFVTQSFNLTGNQLKNLIYTELPIVNATRHRRPI
jgi:hypothetical protein